MKLKNKGFTLIELLAMLVVLGILMAVTVPNITGILNQSKTNIIKEDIDKMVNTTKNKISSHKEIPNPANGKCLVFTLKFLNDNNNFGAGPNNGKYDEYDSIVVVKRMGTKYQYYVRLVEDNNVDKYGVDLMDYEQFQKDADTYIKTITNATTVETATTSAELSSDNIIKTFCSGTNPIQGFYKNP